MSTEDVLMSDEVNHTSEPEPPAQEDRRGGATATQTKPRRVKPTGKNLPPWKLVLHNDDVNTEGDVVEAIAQITPLSPEVAKRKMLEAHTRGRSLLLVTHRELAELYRERFTARTLTTTIEPAE